MKHATTLSLTDRAILASYDSVLDGLSTFFGDGIEFVLHSLEDLDHSAIKIINGHYSNRKVGAPITNLALELLQKINLNKHDNPNMIYQNQSKNGSPIKAATFPIFGENKKIIGLICINFHLDIPLHIFLNNFFNFQENIRNNAEMLASNSEDIIISRVEEAKKNVWRNEDIALHNKNKEIITILFYENIFSYKNSVEQVADLLNLSKNTIYLHIRNLKKN